MSEKKIMILCVAGLALVLLGGGGGFYFLWFNVLAAKEKELAEVKAEIDAMNAKIKKIPDLKKDVETLKKDAEERLKSIPNLERKEYDAFVDLLDKQRKQAGVFVSKASWVVPPKLKKTYPPSIHKAQYEMTVTGGFFQLLRFLNLLEGLRRFVNVESFTVLPVAAPGSSGKGRVTALTREMKLVLYSFTYKQSTKPPEAPAAPPKMQKSVEIPD